MTTHPPPSTPPRPGQRDPNTPRGVPNATPPAHHSTPDRGSSPGRRPGHKKSWALLAVALAAQVLVVLDISVVNTALPTIGRSLHLQSCDLQWLVTAYLLMSGGGCSSVVASPT